MMNTMKSKISSPQEVLRLQERLARLRHIALDMDGTIYCGGQLFKETIPFLEQMSEVGVGFSFLTNNSSKSTTEYIEKLGRHGIKISSDKILISSHAAASLARRLYPQAKRVFAVGTVAFQDELRGFGYEVVGRESAGVPDAVIVGFDPDADYKDICKAAYWIQAGLPYLATHPDAICPCDEETILLDCGAVCAAIHHATGRHPDHVAGKPDPAMIYTLCEKLGIELSEVAMVGDRLYTDIRMAKNSGSLGVLVLTGETKLEDLAQADTTPDIVARDLNDLASLVLAARDGATHEVERILSLSLA